MELQSIAEFELAAVMTQIVADTPVHISNCLFASNTSSNLSDVVIDSANVQFYASVESDGASNFGSDEDIG